MPHIYVTITHDVISSFARSQFLLLFLLRDNPAERLGYQKGGISEIQKHK